MTCAQFTVWSEDANTTDLVVSWVYGYWSAYNRALHQTDRPMKNVFDSTVDGEALTAQLTSICKSEPALGLVFAADRIFDRLPESAEEPTP